VVRIRVAVPRHNYLGLEFIDTPHSGFEIIDLEPEKHSVAIGLIVLIPNGTVMVIDVKPVQLKDQSVSRFQSFVLVPAVIAFAGEQALIPAAASFDISDSNERLRTHKTTSGAWVGTLNSRTPQRHSEIPFWQGCRSFEAALRLARQS
jgi:hypothetical protein